MDAAPDRAEDQDGSGDDGAFARESGSAVLSQLVETIAWVATGLAKALG